MDPEKTPPESTIDKTGPRLALTRLPTHRVRRPVPPRFRTRRKPLATPDEPPPASLLRVGSFPPLHDLAPV